MIDLSTLLAQTTQPAMPGMRWMFINLAYLVASACFIFGLKMLKAPKTARRGNLVAAGGMAIAVFATLLHQGMSYWMILLGLLIGASLGAYLALRVEMKGMPQMVSLFNGFGGLAAAMVGLGEYLHVLHGGSFPAIDVRISVAMSIAIGMITFTGSLIAWAKLEERKLRNPLWRQLFPDGSPKPAAAAAASAPKGMIRMSGTTAAEAAPAAPAKAPEPPKPVSLAAPLMVPQHRWISVACVGLAVLFMLALAVSQSAVWAAVLLLALAAVYGVLFVLPIGGADMPVVIALLNSFSGIGAAATGFVLQNNALIIGGSLVGASGFILTTIMCKAMNRSLLNVLAGGFGTAPADAGAAATGASAGTIRKMDPEEAAMVLDAAQNVVIIPGYGMAVAQAQHAVAELASFLQKKGASVKFAVHPVAGRMPGHMNVLLAEANVPYEQLADLEINPEFPQCDVALVIGANDVVNPAARHDTKSPIYGMPIFDADRAKTVMVSKRSMNPGYAGIENELFYLPNTVMLFGDAKATVAAISKALKEA